jgi:protoporphyrinogen oxidase
VPRDLKSKEYFADLIKRKLNFDMEPYSKAQPLILGGGISGLTAAQTLKHQRQKFVLLEKCPTLGGLTRTVEVGEFCFDYTGHFLHLTRYPTPADIPFAGLNNEDWTQVSRQSCCLVGDQFVSAPIQYNLGELPPDLLAECAASYENRPKNGHRENASFRDFIVNGFGERLADLFLIPQNEKTMAVSLDLLSHSAVRRFFPPPDDEMVRKGMRAGPRDTLGYNAHFWYPKVGGIGRLVDGLRAGLDQCILNQNVTSFDLDAKSLTTSTGETYRWNMLFSSIPLKQICRVSSDAELVNAAAGLSHSTTISFNIGLRGKLPAKFQDIHWLYVPDRNIPFYRVGFYSNISKGICTPGHSALYVEVGVSPEQAQRADLVNELQPEVLRWLEKLGWVAAKDVICVVTHILPCAYVHHTKNRDSLVKFVLDRLRRYDVFPIGRYGLWDYTSMEDSIGSARSTVLEVLSCSSV